MARRRTQYARNGPVQLTYQAEGEGRTVACSVGTVSGLTLWEHPLSAPFFDRIARFAECLVTDPRGTGRSDPLRAEDAVSLEEQSADFVAVLDDHRVERAYVMGIHAGAATALHVAATYPERVAGLFIVNGWARLIEDDGYPGISQEVSDALMDAHGRHFGTGVFAQTFAPSRGRDPSIKDFFATVEQRGASRAQAVLLTRMEQEADVRHLLDRITAPTIVMHNRDNAVLPPSYGRYIANHIAGARFIEFRGTDHAFFLEDPEPVLVELEQFMTGVRPRPAGRRTLATVLFTDIVDSTRRAAEVGDGEWRDLLRRHHETVRDTLRRFGGREINTNGDSFLAYFDTPSAAIDCGLAAIDDVHALGLEIRVGVHTGECEWLDDELQGISVHIGARVGAIAAAGEVLVSRTVKDLVIGKGTRFVDRGTHELKGVPEAWQLFAVCR